MSSQDSLMKIRAAIEERYLLKSDTSFCVRGVGICVKDGKPAIGVMLPTNTSEDEKLRIEAGLESEFQTPVQAFLCSDSTAANMSEDKFKETKRAIRQKYFALPALGYFLHTSASGKKGDFDAITIEMLPGPTEAARAWVEDLLEAEFGVPINVVFSEMARAYQEEGPGLSLIASA